MDTSRQVTDGITSKSELLGATPRQRRSIAEKRRIVEETLVEGASVARVARAHGINATMRRIMSNRKSSWAGWPRFLTSLQQPTHWVARSSRSLRRAGYGSADGHGILPRIRLLPNRSVGALDDST